MKNNPNSSTQVTKVQIPTFDSLYKNRLSDAVEKFKIVRQKLYFSSISAVSGIIMSSSLMYIILRFFGIEKVENGILVWMLFFALTTMFLLIHNERRNRDSYGQLLTGNYTLLNFSGFILFQFFNIIGSHGSSLFLFSLMITISVGVLIFISSDILSNYAAEYRRTVLDEMMMYMGFNMRYTPEGKINSREYADSEIVNFHKRNYTGLDLVELEYGIQQFKFCNMRVIGNNSSPKDNFMGVFLVADISQNLKGIIKIANRDDTKMDNFLNNLMRVDRLAMQTNYPELEKYFKVSATHPQEAAELLTPAFIKRLLRFCRKINLTSTPTAPMLFRLHLKQQKLYMTFKFGLDDGSLFQIPRPIGKIDYKNTLHVNYARLKMIIDWIEDLHLTNKEWKKIQI